MNLGRFVKVHRKDAIKNLLVPEKQSESLSELVWGVAGEWYYVGGVSSVEVVVWRRVVSFCKCVWRASFLFLRTIQGLRMTLPSAEANLTRQLPLVCSQ